MRVARRLRAHLESAGLGILAAVAVGLAVPGAAQVPAETVQWTAAAYSKPSAGSAGAVTLELSGRVADGWHVYALKQAPGGPTPLRVTLEANGFARLAGKASGTPPQRKFDSSFGLETQFYSGSFRLYLPVRVAPQPAAGKRSIPVSVRFQTCNGRVCEPPKTIHLLAPIDAAPEA